MKINFITLEKNEKIDNKMTDYEVIISKLGMGEMLGLFKEDNGISFMDNDIELAYQRQVIADNAELREFCANRQDNITGEFIDVELNNQIKVNEGKLKEINNLLDDLSSM